MSDGRSLIAGIGPITVDPDAQNLGVGRKLMKVVMANRSYRGGAPAGMRLRQALPQWLALALHYSRL